jgi:hypothetical protein
VNWKLLSDEVYLADCVKKEEPNLLENRKFDTLAPDIRTEACLYNDGLKSETNDSQIFHGVETGRLKERLALTLRENEILKDYIKKSETLFKPLLDILAPFRSILNSKGVKVEDCKQI